MLESFKELKIEKINRDGTISKETIIDEIIAYKIPDYEYGKIVRLKTKKIEIFKKRSSRKFFQKDKTEGKLEPEETIQYVVNYSSPDFVLSGFKKNEEKSAYYPDGNPKKFISENLFKVKWFNYFQQKFSEEYLPERFFTDEMKFEK